MMRSLSISVCALALGGLYATACVQLTDRGCDYTMSCSAESGGQASGGHAGIGGSSGGRASGGSDSGGQAGTGATGSGGEGANPGGAGGAISGGTGGVSPNGGTGGTIEPPCDEKLTPRDNSCVVKNALGVFVSPNGSDTALGTKEQPFKTLGKGIAAAGAAGKRVYACTGTAPYAEAIKIGSATKPQEIYGGLDCTTWTVSDASKRTVLASPTPVGLEIEGVTGLKIVDFEIKGAAGIAGKESSIGVWVKTSTGVVLERVTAQAGKGLDGADGKGRKYEGAGWKDFADLVGLPPDPATGADATLGGAGCLVVCPGRAGTKDADRTSKGGNGGGKGASAVPSTDGTPDYPPLGTTGLGGKGGVCDSKTANGTSGPVGSDGTPPTALGQLTLAGWQPATGTPGQDGKPGQAGGGGSGSDSGRGGGGGCGACGGAGADAGQGGGASIAVLSWQSEIKLTTVTLVTDGGGKGGKGVAGENGQARVLTGGALVGGSGANPDGSDACSGGRGGPGGNGGASSGAPGGLSIGVLYAGSEPTLDDTTKSALEAKLGAAGLGGDGVTGTAVSTAGPVGVKLGLRKE